MNQELRIKGIYIYVLLFALFIILNSLSLSKAYAQTTVDVNKYLNSEYVPISFSSVNPVLQQKLETEVNRMLIDQNADGKYDHLAPLVVMLGVGEVSVYHLGGLKSSENYNRPILRAPQFWVDTTETLYVLSMAYPYLTPATQVKVRAFLTEELKNYNPLTYSTFGNIRTGIPRENWQVPTDLATNAWPPVEPAIESAYAIWLYQKNTGDSTFLTTTNWNNLVGVYNKYKAAIAFGRKPFYSEMGGLIGFIRLANARNDTAMVNDATALLTQFMQNDGTNFTTMRQNNTSILRGGNNWVNATFANIPPEIGNYIKDVALTDASVYINDITSIKHIPSWYQARGEAAGLQYQAQNPYGNDGMLVENPNYLPTLSYSLFLGKAYIQGESQQNLIKYLDIPWALGDLYYINKVVAAIEAPTNSFSPTPIPSPSASPSPSPAKPGDIDGNNKVDIFDYNILLTNFGKSGTGIQGDIDNNGKVDIFDYNILLTNFGK